MRRAECYNRADFIRRFWCECGAPRKPQYAHLLRTLKSEMTGPNPALQHRDAGSGMYSGIIRIAMKRLTCVLALLLLCVTAAGASDKAKALYKQGLAAETRLDYVAAYNLYHQAYDLKPADLTYRASFERVRFLAAASLVHQGELLVNSGKLQEALTMFERALGIDPSSFIAQQEANKVRDVLRKNQQIENGTAPPPDPNLGAAQAHGAGRRARSSWRLSPIRRLL